MLYTFPDYYQDFACTAGDCEDTCCSGWQIMVDQKSLKKYKEEKGPYRKVLKKKIDWREYAFRREPESRRCAFLKEDNLCEMYQQLGADSLCRTCRIYPRHIEVFEDVREVSLSLSCPEVARILLSRQEPVHFLQKELDREEHGDYEDFDPFLYSMLLDLRGSMIRILQERGLPMPVRMILTMGMAHEAQMLWDQGQLFSYSELIQKYEEMAASSLTGESAATKKASKECRNWEKRFRNDAALFRKMYRLELLNSDWEDSMIEAETILFQKGSEEHQRIWQEFEAWLEGADPERLGFHPDILSEQIMVYFIYTYFCGAVYDGHILASYQLASMSLAFLWDLYAACWVLNERELTFQDIHSLTYRYSRELEHSDKNLDLLFRIR